MPMAGIGMYEGYTHMANLFLSKMDSRDKEQCIQEEIWQIIDKDSELDGGVTQLTTGDLAVRIFGYRAQKLQQTADMINKTYEKQKY